MFDPVQAPSLRQAFELVNAAILEADSGLRHQILDRARDKDFAGTRFSGNARADVKRETEHLRSAHLNAGPRCPVWVFRVGWPMPEKGPLYAHLRKVEQWAATGPANGAIS
jgi:hypothetical protein